MVELQTRIAKAREELLELKLRSDSLNPRTMGECLVELQTRIAKANPLTSVFRELKLHRLARKNLDTAELIF